MDNVYDTLGAHRRDDNENGGGGDGNEMNLISHHRIHIIFIIYEHIKCIRN